MPLPKNANALNVFYNYFYFFIKNKFYIKVKILMKFIVNNA